MKTEVRSVDSEDQTTHQVLDDNSPLILFIQEKYKLLSGNIAVETRCNSVVHIVSSDSDGEETQKELAHVVIKSPL